ncbi:MAG TPA: ribosome-recycling factor [Candidatus Portnoybacteria bacterium]|jgi:ribosome recycling factor|nr:ribosome-recycling factor [Candidatus Portnoybacteria bacterium]MDD5752224.1 ribosome-recycling factor [Candidatus Portnoybacteria bacterium]HNU96764.1 ribosome-recycling factor [Candidatus Portnoybacteria bacterium]HOZ16488.1 ribosome-recycling factor [Candidatus Portnoybacteria bacterium]HPH52248.1 ribosome-recycling factor [Candidatus Portnoybacteria bacterium]
MYKQLLENLKQEFEKALAFLKAELGKIKTSRATPTMVEDIEIECYNQKFSLKQLAAINVIGAKLITIQPWDKTVMQEIERGVRNKSPFSPVVDGDLIRINIPSLDEEQRREYVKIASEKSEETKISMRLHREKVWKEIQEMEKKGELREDDKFRAKDDLQKLMDDYNKKINEMHKAKETDIMTI